MSYFAEYVTVYGDRWDTVAQKAYGDCFRIQELTDANPEMKLYPVFPGGLTLKVPIVETFSNTTDPEQMPLWKR